MGLAATPTDIWASIVTVTYSVQAGDAQCVAACSYGAVPAMVTASGVVQARIYRTPMTGPRVIVAPVGAMALAACRMAAATDAASCCAAKAGSAASSAASAAR